MSEAKTVHDALAVANYFLEKAKDRGGLDSLQVMKLAYLAHGFVLGALDQPLVPDDILAWKYGPVIRKIYEKLPGGAQKIPTNLASVPSAALQGDEKSIADQIFDKYGQLSGIELSNLTHREGTPWKVTWDLYGQNAVIPQDLIRDYFRPLVKRVD